MIMITVSYQDAIDFTNAASDYLNTKGRKPSSLTYALDRMVKKLKPHIEDFNDKIGDLKEKFQMKDKTDGVFLFHDLACTQPKFTAENHSAFRKAYTALKKETFDVEPFYATTIPEGLEAIWYSMFHPFVIEEIPLGE